MSMLSELKTEVAKYADEHGYIRTRLSKTAATKITRVARKLVGTTFQINEPRTPTRNGMFTYKIVEVKYLKQPNTQYQPEAILVFVAELIKMPKGRYTAYNPRSVGSVYQKQLNINNLRRMQ